MCSSLTRWLQKLSLIIFLLSWILAVLIFVLLEPGAHCCYIYCIFHGRSLPELAYRSQPRMEPLFLPAKESSLTTQKQVTSDSELQHKASLQVKAHVLDLIASANLNPHKSGHLRCNTYHYELTLFLVEGNPTNFVSICADSNRVSRFEW